MTKNISIVDVPDMIDDLFRLCTRLMQKDNESFMRSEHASNLVNLAMECFNMQHRDAHTSAMKLLIEIVMLAGEQKAGRLPGNMAGQVVGMFATEMVAKSLEALVVVLPSNLVTDIADLWGALKEFDIQNFELLFNQCLNDFIQKPEQQAHIQRNNLYVEPIFQNFAFDVKNIHLDTYELETTIRSFVRLFR